ncbi:hypothetical protein HNR23_005001 [Nocardiopsis mwathae]|uniref:Uncharacterized protein n=1 Tax=Nocardiopsis mwathae TaxID=1472723 RepID=A0A7W9YPN9_9ACTN|nr:hypothetical protein [Nocardiopsis mwathae]MBB6174941.1 hypothetical protein [Nocardiopsis mwathae]
MIFPFRGPVLIGGVVLVVTLNACALGTEDEPLPTSEPSPAPSEAEPSAEEAALEAYEGMWSVVVEISRTTEADSSDLDRFAEGQALELAQHGLGAESDENVVARGAPTFSPEVVSLDEREESAEIEDCMDSSEWLREDADTGELAEEAPDGPILRKIEATADYDGLAWRVSSLRIFEQGTC